MHILYFGCLATDLFDVLINTLLYVAMASEGYLIKCVVVCIH